MVLGPAGSKQTSVFCELFALSPLKYFKSNTLWAERTPISILPFSIMIEALGYLQMKITFLASFEVESGHIWASLVAQLVKNLSAIQEIWVRSLGREDPVEKGKVIHSSILAWRIPRTV